MANKGQFQKGNPGGPGRPKGGTELALYIKQQTQDGREIADAVLKTLRKTKSEKIRIWAAEWLADRAFGKAPESLDITSGGESVRDFLVGWAQRGGPGSPAGVERTGGFLAGHPGDQPLAEADRDRGGAENP